MLEAKIWRFVVDATLEETYYFAEARVEFESQGRACPRAKCCTHYSPSSVAKS